jgi:hypothetical protein
MRRHALAAACTVMGLAGAAQAGPNDVVLGRLATEVGAGEGVTVIGDSLAFRSVVSELGVVLAPRLMSPADTLGFGGFQFAADIGFSTITDTADYWRVLESSPDPGGAMAGASHGDGVLTTMGLHVRKGIWLPLPSFEVGAGVVHLDGSGLWSTQGYAKFALHEGYHGLLFLPSLAVRGAASRLMGSQEVDLTVASVDVSASKTIGIVGTVGLEPYLGWNTLIMIARSEVIDRTPQLDGDRRLNFVFRDQDNILRHRIFTGFKLQHHVFALLFEANFALAGSSVDDRAGTDMDCADVALPTDSCDSTDQARAQQSYTISVALDF